jgi:hypothetical protein
MVALKIQNFGGMVPAVDSQLLPQASASFAENTWVHTGAVQGYKRLKKIYTPASTGTQKVFRVPISKPDADRIPNSYWLEFPSPHTDVIRSPTSGDQFDRYYWASPVDRPRYNSRTRIAAGDPALILGVPAPTVAPGVSVTGGSVPLESRAYVYTWVTAFGEEGPPSPPTVVNANGSGTWNITMTAPDSGATTGRLLDKVRIYRTVSGVGGETDYFLVTELTIATTTFADNIPKVVGNRIIQSLFWTEPPLDLQGFVSMPNGIIASWRNNEVWFCEPFRPHAWPVPYQLSVDSRIVGCGVVGQTLIVCTEGAPYAITGVNPGSMSQSRLAEFQPCTSRGSIVSLPMGVAFASPNGLVLCAAGMAQVITEQLLQKEDWYDLLRLPTVEAALFNGGYYAYGSTAIGCFSDTGFDTDAFLQLDYSGAFSGAYIDPNDARVAVSKLTQPVPVRNVYTDIWTSEVFILRDDGLFWLDQTRACEEPRQPYKWRSKIFETPNQKNFEAMRVYISTHRCTPELPPTRNTNLIQTLQPNQWGLVRLYADGVLRMTREIRESGEMFRIPSGFKATFWQVEVEARVRLQSIEIATTAKELGRV